MSIKVNHSEIPDPLLVKSYFDSILTSGILTNNGPFVKSFEEDLRNQTGVPFCHTTSSGTTALEMSIRALDLKGEIITTPFSFIASASSILWEKCTPVFVDINPETLCIDPNQIEQCITEKTSGILAVHTFGNPCDIERIESIAKLNNLKTIFDGAHAFGISYKNKSIFSYGDISTTSFHAYKIVSAGEGGAIFTNDKSLGQIIYEMRYFGKNEQNHPVRTGTNAKMNEFNAALGKVSLKYLDKEISGRRIVAKEYLRVFSNVSTVQLPTFLENEGHNFSYFPIVLNSEEDVFRLIENGEKENIEIRRYFHPSLSELSFMPNKKPTPIANKLSRLIVCLPIHSSLSKEEISQIIQLVKTLN